MIIIHECHLKDSCYASAARDVTASWEATGPATPASLISPGSRRASEVIGKGQIALI